MLANRTTPFAGYPAAYASSPVYSDGVVCFDSVINGQPKRIVVTAELLEEHALRRPMSAPELEAYASNHRIMLLRAADAASAMTLQTDTIIIDRIEQLV